MEDKFISWEEFKDILVNDYGFKGEILSNEKIKDEINTPEDALKLIKDYIIMNLYNEKDYTAGEYWEIISNIEHMVLMGLYNKGADE